MKNIQHIKSFFCLLVVSFLFSSCEKDDLDLYIPESGPLSLKVSEYNIVLDEHFPNKQVVFTWTTGVNFGTSSSINYVLEIDKKDNNFANALQYEMGSNSFTFSLTYSSLNYILLNTFGILPNTAQDFDVRIKAIPSGNQDNTQIINQVITITAYQPVSSNLYIVGSATPSGWNIGSAIQMTASTTPGTFVYQGSLIPGTFKFAVNQDTCFCQDFYTKDATDDNKMVYNLGGSGNDLQWNITQSGQYKVTANILDLTITIESITAPPFSQLWIVGDASPSGWDINTPMAFTQSTSNPYIFTYEGNFTTGDFKILAGSTGDWCGQWYRPLVNGQALNLTSVEQNSGCTTDNKWTITASTVGRYKITLDTANNTININKVNLYIIGDAGPNGWNISNPNPMIYSNGNFIYNGPMNVGDFKISKFTGNWCDGQWINAATADQSVNNTNYILTNGCDGPDNKWKLQPGDESSNYQISINLDTNTLTITY